MGEIMDRERDRLRNWNPDGKTVEVPLWALEALRAGGICRVCTGSSPAWDGHDLNPACRGAGLARLDLALRDVRENR